MWGQGEGGRENREGKESHKAPIRINFEHLGHTRSIRTSVPLRKLKERVRRDLKNSNGAKEASGREEDGTISAFTTNPAVPNAVLKRGGHFRSGQVVLESSTSLGSRDDIDSEREIGHSVNKKHVCNHLAPHIFYRVLTFIDHSLYYF